MNKIGIIGLGNAGAALATALLRNNVVSGFDRDQRRCTIAKAAGVSVLSDAREVVEHCPVVIMSLPNPDISKAVLRECRSALKDRLVIECSTVAPQDMKELLDIVQTAGASLAEAAILGGVQKLAAGKGTFLVGASTADYAIAKPILESAAEKIYFLGGLGQAMKAKLVNNAIAHAVMVVLVEGAALALAQGVPLEVFYELAQRESGLMRPLTYRFAERIMKRNFEGGMSMSMARKDSMLALEVAKDLGVPLFAISSAHTAYEIANREGLEKLDYSALSMLWEKWMGIRFEAETSEKDPARTPDLP